MRNGVTDHYNKLQYGYRDGIQSSTGSSVLARPTRCPAAAFLSALRLQHCGEPGSPCARSRDVSSESVAQPHAVKPVAVMSDVFDCLEVHYGMPSDLDERIAT
jgi:hypothetical protein